MSIAKGMTAKALSRAQVESYYICRSGQQITIRKPKIGYIDEGGTATDWDSLTFMAHPIRFSPFDRKTVAKVAWAETVSLIFMISVRELVLKDPYVSLEDLKSYNEIIILGKKYNLKYADYINSFGTGFLNVIIGATIES